MASSETKKLKNKAKASLTLLLVAVISISTATYAWFSMSNSTTVQDMTIQVGTSTALKVSTFFSTNLEDYKATLTNEDVNALLRELGSYTDNGLGELRLWPLTSFDGVELYTQSENTTSSATHNPADPHATKGYLELPLWFMASVDMNVYLNQDDAPDTPDSGTLVVSADGNTAKQTYVD